jgi:hypothetical protein
MRAALSLKRAAYFVVYGGIVALAFWAGRLSHAPAPTAPVNNIKNYKNSTYTDGRAALATTDSGTGLSLSDLLNAKGKPNADLLAAWAKNLTPGQIAEALKALQDLPAGLQRDAILNAVINAWATGDPQGFLANAGNVTVPRLREVGVDSALRTWAADDPKAALTWLQQNPGSAPPAAQRQRFAAAIAGYASTDPQGALTAVAALGGNSPADLMLRNNAIQALTNAVADSGNFSDALTMFGQLPAGQLQNRAYTNLVQRWAETNPEDASTWIATLTDPNQRNQLGTRVAQTWAASDPAAAATWAAQMDNQAALDPSGDGQSTQLLASAIRSWSAYDLDAPAQFLNQLPASEGKDDAVALFAMSAGQQDPDGAIQWVGTIADPDMRSRAATMVALEMLSQDPDAANQFLANTTLLTDQQKQALTNLPPRMATRLGFALAGGMGGGANAGTGGPGGGGGGRGNRLGNMVLNGGGIFNYINNQGANNGGGQNAPAPQPAPSAPPGGG